MSDAIRERMMTIKGEFTSLAFKDIKNADSAMTKMEQRGEIKCVGTIRSGMGAARKVYVIVKLKELRPPKNEAESQYTAIRRRAKEKDRAIVDNWRRVFPNWFSFNFKTIGRTIHRLKMGD